MSQIIDTFRYVEIIKEYPGVTEEDIQACLLFATKSLEDTDFMPFVKKVA